MSRSIFQVMRDKLKPVETKIHNPLSLSIGKTIQLDVLDLREKFFKLYAIRENVRTIEGQDYKSVDYDVVCGEEKVRIRLVSNGNSHDVLLLSLYFECGYDEAQNGLAQSVGGSQLDIDWEGKRTYFRIRQGLTSPYQVEAKLLEDLDGNGRVDSDEVRNQTFEYWDYHTELPNEAGQKFVEYLFVEKDHDNGWWQIWRGTMVDPQRVEVL